MNLPKRRLTNQQFRKLAKSHAQKLPQEAREKFVRVAMRLRMAGFAQTRH